MENQEVIDLLRRMLTHLQNIDSWTGSTETNTSDISDIFATLQSIERTLEDIEDLVKAK